MMKVSFQSSPYFSFTTLPIYHLCGNSPMCNYFTVALISFEEVSEEMDENVGLRSFYVITNFNATDDISIQLDAMIIEERTNATEGKNINALQVVRLDIFCIGSDYDIVTLEGLLFVHDTPSRGVDIRLRFTDDNLVEGHEVICISLTQPTIIGLDNNDGARLVASRSSLLVVIRDDDGKDWRFESSLQNTYSSMQ